MVECQSQAPRIDGSRFSLSLTTGSLMNVCNVYHDHPNDTGKRISLLFYYSLIYLYPSFMFLPKPVVCVLSNFEPMQ